MNKIIIIVVSILAFVGSYFIMRSLPSNNKIDNQTMVSFKTEFMNGCMEEGNYVYCTCVYDDLQKRLGDIGFLKLAVNFSETKEIPDSIYPSITMCFNK